MPTGKKRPKPYVWISWLAEVMAGAKECRFPRWYSTHYQGFAEAPSDFDLVKWTSEHNEAVQKEAARLRAEGWEVFLENGNKLHLVGKNGAALGGKADIVAHKGEDHVVIDVKTGKQKDADFHQVSLYVACLPIAGPEHCQGKTLRGEVLYKDHRQEVPASIAEDPTFRASFKGAMDLLASEKDPGKEPSYFGCRWCKLTKADCAERVEVDPRAAAMASKHDLF